MSFLCRYTEYDRKFLEECADLRGVNCAVIVSMGEDDECDYDELTEEEFLVK